MPERAVPAVGSKAPAFKLPDTEGRVHSLADYRGRTVVLYFYPKDDTPGCTVEACDFRDDFKAIDKAGAVVLGVSPDPPERHARFREKYGLPFTLLSDPDRKTMAAYGAWGEKVLYGLKREGVIRSTFLIDAEGRIAHAWPNVKAKGHVAQVLTRLNPANP